MASTRDKTRKKPGPGADPADRTETHLNPIPGIATQGVAGEPTGLPSLDAITDDVELSKEALRTVIRDAGAPAAARAQAARTLAEMAGALGKNAKPPADAGKPLAEMTRAEMEAELAALEGR